MTDPSSHTRLSSQARQRTRAIAVAQTNEAVHVGAALVGSLVVGGGIWIGLAHLVKALF